MNQDLTRQSIPSVPQRQVRARFSNDSVRVYQAFSPEIADAAIAAGTFTHPFKRARMTWIKPSFLWMMYRSGWATKTFQARVLGVDISRRGFEWALAHSSLSHYDPAVYASHEEWTAAMRTAPVRVQWDPERNLHTEAMPWKTIQIGIGGDSVHLYVEEWIVGIEDVTALAYEIKTELLGGNSACAASLVPIEIPYPIPHTISQTIGCTNSS